MPLTTQPEHNWHKPDYAAIFADRADRYMNLRATQHNLPQLRAWYAQNPAQFIEDWGMTFDPRNPERGLPSLVPFVLWPKQVEYIDWVMERWKNGQRGLVEKSRDSGASWLSIALACTLCLFRPGMIIGFGSRKEILVDHLGDEKSLFEKIRIFMSNLPPEFRGAWSIDKHASYMKILFPDTGSLISGEAGDDIGRGARASMYFVDESAFLERAELTERSLSQTTNCRIDISTPNGMANPFAQKRHSGKVKVFTFSWRDDPRKDDAWYAKQVADLDDVTIAQEINADYNASVEGVVIPSAWVQSAIKAYPRLRERMAGRKRVAFDVADQGPDKCALAGKDGMALTMLEEWSGGASDTFKSAVRAIVLTEQYGATEFLYDADGLGGPVRGDANKINEDRAKENRPPIRAVAFRGSGAVYKPESEMVKGRQNKNYFKNFKAQSWFHLRLLFRNIHRWEAQGIEADLDDIIVIDPTLPLLGRLMMELSQPTYSFDNSGKMVIDKAPDGTSSPNLADAVMIAFSPGSTGIRIADSELDQEDEEELYGAEV